MAIRNNANDLHRIKTAVCVWAVYIPLLSSNESPQHGLRKAGINARCKFQKTKAECNERVIYRQTCTMETVGGSETIWNPLGIHGHKCCSCELWCREKEQKQQHINETENI
ncbi:hypothetical protein TNCV_1299851 [Trichonephila clavipes]|nr:hypothetical protein TNCV_1299851 [Trichonephila clavipes]